MAVRGRRDWRLPLERVAVGKNALSDALALAAVRAIGAEPRARGRGRRRPRGARRDAVRQPARRARVRQRRRLRRARAAVRRRRRDGHAARARHRADAAVRDGVQPARAREPSSTRIAAALRRAAAPDAVELVHGSAWRSACRRRLAELGVATSARRRWPSRRRASAGSPDNNPRPLDTAGCAAILRAAWHGDPSLLGERAAA